MPTLPKSVQRPWNIKKSNQKFDRSTKRDHRYKTYRWRQLRKEVLTEQSWTCQTHLKQGKVKHGRICDHISIELREIDFWDKSNLQCLCDRCHNRKSQTERGGGVSQF